MMRWAAWSGALAIASASAVAASSVAAQGSSRTDEAWSRPGPVLTRSDLATAGLFVVATGALMPFDERIAHWTQRPGLQHDAPLRHVAGAFRTLGDPGTLVLGAATYGTGLLLHDRTTADVGLHATGAIVVGSVVTGLLKVTLGRARPYAVADSNAHDYAFGRGLRRGSAYQSLPSGHTTAAFALAAAVASETAHRAPHAARVVTPVAYGAATLVGLSRLYHNDHWASDVTLAAGVGTVSGLAVVRYQHARPTNALDRRLLPAVTLAPAVPNATGAGPRPAASPVALAWTVPFR